MQRNRVQLPGPTWWITTIYNFSPRPHNTLFWSLWAKTPTWYIDIYARKNKSKANKQKIRIPHQFPCHVFCAAKLIEESPLLGTAMTDIIARHTSEARQITDHTHTVGNRQTTDRPDRWTTQREKWRIKVWSN